MADRGQASDTVRRCFYFTGNLTLGLASRGEIAMDRTNSVLDYDRMIALLIKRGGDGEGGKTRPCSCFR